jgi:DNA helicase-2/ATP-dependent DNA helicase PcrA
VHSFALTQIVLPYARTAQISVPDNFRVATTAQQRAAMQVAYEAVIARGENPNDWRLAMDRYQRTHVNREAASWRQDEELVSLIEAYERELRRNRLIDFDDMPLLALRALTRHEWLRRAILAKYPILVVDEYQDLGTALHQMVMGLCFSTGIRLSAVGDTNTNQSIYGFTGANPALLERLSQRPDVETVQLRINYPSGARIVTASE